ncbi:hypothetical protein CK477_11750 [Enterobacter cloacae]|nr:hypothetical protein CK477_11750 [Enterobacter cloacae]
MRFSKQMGRKNEASARWGQLKVGLTAFGSFQPDISVKKKPGKPGKVNVRSLYVVMQAAPD